MKRATITVLAAGWCVSVATIGTAQVGAPAAGVGAQPAAGTPAAEAPKTEAASADASPRPVDLVICLDTSGSMDGLIDAARQRLWGIVSDLATAKPRPALRVALLSFGNDGYSAEDGWVRVLQPLTTDLDEVSRQLFALRTNGGTEYVGRVVHKAVQDLDWSKDAGAMKLIVVAGNEGADQDQTFTNPAVCADAISKGIMINTIYCGNPGDSIAPGWREVARLADGEYAAIDQNKNDVIATPHDQKLIELSAALNGTYVAYGPKGETATRNQTMQDSNAASAAPAAAAERASMKAGLLYRNASWDLVDAVLTGEEKDRVKLDEVKAEDLPEALRGKPAAEQRAYLEAKLAERTDLQRQIAAETQKRDAFIEAERARTAQESGEKDFGSVLREAVRRQAAKKGFVWEK
ncbi:MAG: VWA domain-containing protein [Planctomycetota bacterium]|nr:VWA domain-containing protein [Planctomycetota bacterium]